jgi:hypothetical protein
MGTIYYVANKKDKTFIEMGKNYEWLEDYIEFFIDPNNTYNDLMYIIKDLPYLKKWSSEDIGQLCEELILFTRGADKEDILVIGEAWVNFKGEFGDPYELDPSFSVYSGEYKRV